MLCYVLLAVHIGVDAASNTSACVWRRPCVIGLLYSSSGWFQQYSDPGLVVARMFADHINAQPCGFGGLGIGVELQMIDVASNTSYVGDATRLLLERNISVLMLPEGALGEFAVQVAGGTNIPVISGSSADPTLYRTADNKRRFANVVGVLTPSDQYFSSFLPIMRINSYRRVAVVQSSELINSAICNGIPAALADNSLQLVQHAVIDQLDGDVRSRIREALLHAQQLEAEVLLTCMGYNCDMLYDLLREIDYNPAAHATFECANRITQVGVESAALAQYSYAPVQFDCRLFGQQFSDPFDLMFPAGSFVADGAVTDAPPMQFCRAYQSAARGVPMSSLTTAQLAAFYVVNDLVVAANSTAGADLLAKLPSTDIQCFFGLIHFDRYGQNSARQMPQRQLTDTQGTTALIYPFVTAAILPMPTFGERAFQPHFFRTRTEMTYLGFAFAFSGASAALFAYLAYHRAHRIVQTLNLAVSGVLIGGCVLLYWAPLTWSVYDTRASCRLRIPVWVFAFLLLLGPIYVSSDRMVRIVANRGHAATAPFTTGIACRRMLLFWAPQLVLAILWASIASFAPTVIVTDPYRPAWNQIVCESPSGFVWATLATLAGMLLVCAASSWRLRNISPKFNYFNNSRHVAVLMFLVITFAAVVVAIQALLPEYRVQSDAMPVKFLLRSMLTLFVAIIAQSFYFFDCIQALHRGPSPSRKPVVLALPISVPQPHPLTAPPTEPNRPPPPPVSLHVDSELSLASLVHPDLLAPANSLAMSESSRRSFKEPSVLHL